MKKLPLIMASLFGALSLLSCSGGESSEDSASLSSSGSSRSITFVAGPVFKSITVGEVQAFAATGVAKGDIALIIRFGGVEAEELRALITKTMPIELLSLDKLLNSSLGIAVLKKVGTVLHPRRNSNTAVQAVRSALILSLADDESLSFVEVLENLPVDMIVDVVGLIALKDEIGGALLQN